MHEQTPRPLPWLDRLAAHVPGFGGYLDRGNRRAADRALRDAVADRLAVAGKALEHSLRDAVDRDALAEITPLERARARIDRLQQKIRAAGSGDDSFYQAHHLDAPKADSLHAFDLTLFEAADALIARLDSSSSESEGWIESDLDELEKKIDERAGLLRGIR